MRPIWVQLADVLSPEECQRIIDSERLKLTKAGFYNEKQKKFPVLKRNSSVSWIRNGAELDDLMLKVVDAISVVSKNVFDIGINYFEPIQFTEYGPLGHYGKHRDVGTDGPLRWISATVELSANKSYIGGGLWIDSEGNKKPERKQGSVIVFPSVLMHSALPVWWGRRNSLVLWGTVSNESPRPN